MTRITRRTFVESAAIGMAGGGWFAEACLAQPPGERPPTRDRRVSVLNPCGRVPVSLIIDDSTCLVNLAHFAIPQFAQVFPDRYRQPWKSLPREIPDSFARRFGEWCHEQGVKGKYSVVPYPACVGWLDRELPGWSREELAASLDLVRTRLTPDWDIHPEMISHTWVIDTKTGRPFAEKSERFMENWRWTDGRSADELADYLAYALRVLKNVGLRCEGITTPGGFGNRVLPELSLATLEACRDVNAIEIPHYFRHIHLDDRSVSPRVENASGLDGPNPRCVVSIIGCTGDWFGGWDGLNPGHADQFITEDGRGGRLPQVIVRGEPAVLVCHWPGIYFNGREIGFDIFKTVVARLRHSFEHLKWMKLSEIARYWAARELTTITMHDAAIEFAAPFAAPNFTLRVHRANMRVAPCVVVGSERTRLKQVPSHLDLTSGAFHFAGDDMILCLDLPRGVSRVELPVA